MFLYLLLVGASSLVIFECVQEIRSKSHIAPLDGIRGIAILLVILYHYQVLYPLFSFGWAGVDLFFVLSGYLIARSWISFRDERNGFRNFFLNRLLRIAPLYFLVIIGFYGLIAFVVKPEHQFLFQYYKVSWPFYFTFLQNWSMILFGKIEANYLDHFWSLAVEVQFYLMAPLLIRFLEKRKAYVGLLIFLAGAFVVRTFMFYLLPGWEHNFGFYGNTFGRIDCFVIGILIFLYGKQHVPDAYFKGQFLFGGLVLVCVLVSGTAGFQHPLMATLGMSSFALLWGSLLAYSISSSSNLIVSILSQSWLRFLGNHSYGIYIFHRLFLRLFEPGLNTYLHRFFPTNKVFVTGLTSVMLIGLTLLVSVISLRVLEQPFLRLKKKPLKFHNI